MSKKIHKSNFYIERRQNMPLFLVIIIVLVIIFLLSMILYYLSGAFANLQGLKTENIKQTSGILSPFLDDGTAQTQASGTNNTTTGTRTTSNGTTERTSTTTSNTSTTANTTTTEDQSSNDNNGNGLLDGVVPTTVETVNAQVTPVVNQANPVISGIVGTVKTLLGQ